MSDRHNFQKGKSLTGLRQAIFIMGCLHKGMSENEICRRFDDDDELVEIWIRFLSDMGWLVKDSTRDRWLLTDIGKLELAQQETSRPPEPR